MTEPALADILDEAAPRLIADVEATMTPTTVALPLRRTIARLPGLMRELVERLRAGRLDTPEQRSKQAIEFDIVPLVTALRLLKQSIYSLIDDRQLPVASRDVRILGGWFAATAETALAAENRRFVDMLDAIPDQLMLHNSERFLIYVNRATAEVAKWAAGLSGEEVLGRRVIDFVRNKDFGKMVDQNIARVLAGERITEEFVLPHPDGARWGEHHVLPLYGADGTIEAITTASRDIHARKMAEARLRLMSKLGTLAESMEHENIIDAVANLAIPELADWCIIHIVENGEVRRGTIVHRDPAQAALANELKRLPPQLHTLPVGKAALAGTSSLVSDVEHAIEGADPAFLAIMKRLGMRSAMVVPFLAMDAPVALAVFAVTPESGRRYGAADLEMAQELARRAGQIIENARLHQQLRQSEARFRLALEQSNITVFETDIDLRIRWGYSSQLDTPDSQLVGKTMSELLGGEVSVELEQLKRRIIATGEGAGMAFSRNRDGKQHHLTVRCEPLRDAGEIVGLTGATIDVTELKEAEEQLARELGFRERMMGVLGHDLRNPVSAVLAIAGLLRFEDGAGPKVREGLGLIEQSTRRMNEMIGALLDFTRLRFHGSLPIAAKSVELDEGLRGVVAELQAANREREIELSVTGNQRGQWDPGRMAQLLANLVTNALCHGARDSAVRIELAGADEVVHLNVSNRGPTIPPESVERLFEPFRQGDESGDVRPRGLGLGLFIVREIVRAHGGTIDVRSNYDLTTFAVTLPRIRPSA